MMDFTDWEWATPKDLECLGMFYGIVGKIEQTSVLEPRLMLIKDITPAGELHGGHVVYKIKSIAFLHIGTENMDIGLLPCKKHQYVLKKKGSGLFDVPQKAALAKTWGTIKNATNTIKNTTQHAAALATSQVRNLKLLAFVNSYLLSYTIHKLNIFCTDEVHSDQTQRSKR